MDAEPSPKHDADLNPASLGSGTHWSIVFSAAKDSSPDARAAFGQLYSAYLPPLLIFLRSKGYTSDGAMDLLQGFFEHLLATRGLSKIKQREKFRCWLLASLKYFSIDVWEKQRAEKRGGGKTHLPIGPEVELGEVEPLDTRLTPEQAYDRKWAIAILKRALIRLAGEYATPARQKVFEALKNFLTGTQLDTDYNQVASALGMNPNTVAVNVARLRERYRQLLREEISDTVEPHLVEEEWRHLIECVTRAPGTGGSESNK